jgi:hypothetical protein
MSHICAPAFPTAGDLYALDGSALQAPLGMPGIDCIHRCVLGITPFDIFTQPSHRVNEKVDVGRFFCHAAEMKNTKPKPMPTSSKYSVIRQLCNLIPEHLVPKLARETGVEEKCRTFNAWSHVVALLFAQLTYAVL